MHTIMAATLRTILLRIDVTNGIVHIVLGLIISFGGPILAAYIMERTTWLEFFCIQIKCCTVEAESNKEKE